jgi:hypothetical protein
MLPIAAAMATSTAPRMVVEQAALLADRSSIDALANAAVPAAGGRRRRRRLTSTTGVVTSFLPSI